MPGLEHGFIRGIAEGVIGYTIGYLCYTSIDSIITSIAPMLEPGALLFATAFKLTLLIAPLQLIAKMKYWSTGYLLGFLAGVLATTKLGLYSTFEIFLYTITGLMIVFRRKIGP